MSTPAGGPAWLRGYTRADLAPDVTAGLTVVVLLIPQAMAYAALAGMPPITGLYAALVAVVVYAFTGSSSHLAYGPVAIVSLLTASAVGPLSGGDPARYAALAGALAVLVGAIHVALGLARAGRVVDLISHPVITGFTAAAGIVIALSQARDLLGIDVARTENALEAARNVAGGVSSTHLPTLAVATVAVAALLLLRRLPPRVPATLLVVVGATVAAVVLGLEATGVRVVGDVPGGLPGLSLPVVDRADLLALLPVAAVLALVSFAESISIGKAIAGRTRETLDADRELLASGAANAAAGLVGGFPVAGSFSRSFLMFRVGGRTPLAGLVAAAALVLTLTLLTPLLEPLPRAVLAAIVVVTVIGLVDVREARRIARIDARDGVVLGVTFVTTLVVGIEAGLVAGIMVNLLLHVARGMRPDVVVLGRLEGTRQFLAADRRPVVVDPDGAVLRLDGPLDFLSARAFTTAVRQIVAARPELRWIVLECTGMARLDATGVHALHELQLQLRGAGVGLAFAGIRGRQRDIIARADLVGDLLEGAAHRSVDEALAALGIPEDDPLRVPQPGERAPEANY
jgi:sulfate permease, SulP family